MDEIGCKIDMQDICSEKLYDVISVNLSTRSVRLLAENKTDGNADAIEMVAASQRGCGEEFCTKVPAGRYKEGDNWDGNEDV